MKPIAFLPDRDIVIHDRTEPAKRTHKKRCRRDAVHIVVAVHDYFFPPNPSHRAIHILHQERVVIRLLGLGMQENLRFLHVREIPASKDSGKKRRNAEPLGKRLIRRGCSPRNGPFLSQRYSPVEL